MNMVRKQPWSGRAALLVVAGTGLRAGRPGHKKPHVVIVATGGPSPVGRVGDRRGYSSGAVGVDILIAAVPQLKDVRHGHRRAGGEHRQPGHER
jgi:hypothetical protein